MAQDSVMMSNRDRLIYMANQIARNFAALAHDDAAKAVADHIRSFWDPRMREQIDQVLKSKPDLLTTTARSAILSLRNGDVPSQTRATEFNGVDQGGHSDAG